MRDDRPRFGIRFRVVNRVLNFQAPQIQPAIPLDDMQRVGMRMTSGVEPALVVESHYIDHQRVILPAPNRIAKPGLFDVLIMGPAVDEYLAPNMRAAFVHASTETPVGNWDPSK